MREFDLTLLCPRGGVEICGHCSNKMIAWQMSIGEKTIKRYKTIIHQKMCIRSPIGCYYCGSFRTGDTQMKSIADLVDWFQAQRKSKHGNNKKKSPKLRYLKRHPSNPAGTKLIKRFSSREKHQGGAMGYTYDGQVPTTWLERNS